MTTDQVLGHLLGAPGPGVLLIAFAIAVLFLVALSSGLAKLGLAWWQALLVLVASLAGSAVNIPLGTVQSQAAGLVLRHGRFGGGGFFVPFAGSHGTMIAINVGGALIPLGVCLYLALRFPRSIPFALLATAVVTFVVHLVAKPIAGVGVVIPTPLPPLVAAGAAIVLSLLFDGTARDRFVAAYIGGTLGTLIGADLLNLSRVASLGTGTASIGGAGTFDGVFLTGLLAVLLIFEPAPSRPKAPQALPPQPPAETPSAPDNVLGGWSAG